MDGHIHTNHEPVAFQGLDDLIHITSSIDQDPFGYEFIREMSDFPHIAIAAAVVLGKEIKKSERPDKEYTDNESNIFNEIDLTRNKIDGQEYNSEEEIDHNADYTESDDEESNSDESTDSKTDQEESNKDNAEDNESNDEESLDNETKDNKGDNDETEDEKTNEDCLYENAHVSQRQNEDNIADLIYMAMRHPEKIDPEWLDDISKYTKNRTISDMINNKEQMYTENDNEQEDSDQWYNQLNFQNYNSQTIDHEELKELICRTAAYPLRSSETMDLIAAVASVAKKEMHLVAHYVHAIMLYGDRRHSIKIREQHEEEIEILRSSWHDTKQDSTSSCKQVFERAINYIESKVNTMEHDSFCSTVRQWKHEISITTKDLIRYNNPDELPVEDLRVFFAFDDMTFGQRKTFTDDIHGLAVMLGLQIKKNIPLESFKPVRTDKILAKDTIMLLYTFWFFLFAARNGHLALRISPNDIIHKLKSHRPLYNVSPLMYTKRLMRCNGPLQVVETYLVYGNRNKSRETECKKRLVAYYREKRKSPTAFDKIKNMIIERKQIYSFQTDKFHPGFDQEVDRLAYLHEKSLVGMINASEEYCERYVKPFPTDKGFLAIKSPCGTGKTVQMKTFIDNQPTDVPIIIVSHRKAFSATMRQFTGQTNKGLFSLYSDIDGAIDLANHPYLICEYESLSRIKRHFGDITIIIDEVNSVLFQTHSLAGDSHGAHMVFSGLMERASCILVLDAYLDQGMINVLGKYAKREPYVIFNTYQSTADHRIRTTQEKNVAIQEVIEAVEAGKNVCIPCTSIESAEELENILVPIIGKNNFQLYSSKSRWKDTDEINATWSQSRVVVYTSTMDCGHSFDIDHFHLIVCFYDSNAPITVETMMQMKARSRKTKDFIVYIPRKHVADNPAMMSIQSTILHIHQNQRQMAQDKCVRYYGEAAYWALTDTYPVCPHLLSYAEHTRRTYLASKFGYQYLCELLMREGFPAGYFERCGADGCKAKELVAKARKEIKDNKQVMTPMQLSSIYSETPRKIFETMLKEEVLVYQDRAVIQAYLNRSLLYKEGSDFQSAMANILQKENLLKEQLANARQTERYREDNLLQIEIKMGLHVEQICATSVKQKFIIASDIMEIFTGKRDPHEVTSMKASEIQERLKCTSVNTEKNRTINNIESELGKVIRSLHRSYLLRCKIEPRHSSTKKEVTMTEGVHMLNDVMRRQYGMTLNRTNKRADIKGKRKRRGDGKRESKKRVYIYEMNDLFKQKKKTTTDSCEANDTAASSDACNYAAAFPDMTIFTDTRPDPTTETTESADCDSMVEYCQGKPLLEQWNEKALTVSRSEILSCKTIHGAKTLSIGSAFQDWIQDSSPQTYGYKPVHTDFTKITDKNTIQDSKTAKLDTWLKVPDTKNKKNRKRKIGHEEDKQYVEEELKRKKKIKNKTASLPKRKKEGNVKPPIKKAPTKRMYKVATINDIFQSHIALKT